MCVTHSLLSWFYGLLAEMVGLGSLGFDERTQRSVNVAGGLPSHTKLLQYITLLFQNKIFANYIARLGVFTMNIFGVMIF